MANTEFQDDYGNFISPLHSSLRKASADASPETLETISISMVSHSSFESYSSSDLSDTEEIRPAQSQSIDAYKIQDVHQNHESNKENFRDVSQLQGSFSDALKGPIRFRQMRPEHKEPNKSHNGRLPPLAPTQEGESFNRIKDEVSILRNDMECIKDSLEVMTGNIQHILLAKASSKGHKKSSKEKKFWDYDNDSGTVSSVEPMAEGSSGEWQGLLWSPDLPKHDKITLRSHELQTTKEPERPSTPMINIIKRTSGMTPSPMTMVFGQFSSDVQTMKAPSSSTTPSIKVVEKTPGIAPSPLTMTTADDFSSLSNPSQGTMILEKRTSSLLRSLEKEMQKEKDRKQSIRQHMKQLREERAKFTAHLEKPFISLSEKEEINPRKKLMFGSQRGYKKTVTFIPQPKQKITAYKKARLFITGMRYFIVLIACVILCMILQSYISPSSYIFASSFQKFHDTALHSQSQSCASVSPIDTPEKQQIITKKDNESTVIGLIQHILQVIFFSKEDVEDLISETMFWV